MPAGTAGGLTPGVPRPRSMDRMSIHHRSPTLRDVVPVDQHCSPFEPLHALSSKQFCGHTESSDPNVGSIGPPTPPLIAPFDRFSILGLPSFDIRQDRFNEQQYHSLN
jgi:hypothetical protein